MILGKYYHNATTKFPMKKLGMIKFTKPLSCHAFNTQSKLFKIIMI